MSSVKPASEHPQLWHELPVVDVLRALETRDSGLSPSEAQRRLKLHGENVIATHRPDSAFVIFLRQFKDFMILLLVAAAVVSGAIGDWSDTLVIAAVLVLNAVIGLIQEYRAERAMAALRDMAAPHATVVRDGKTSTIAASHLVPGDIVLLEAGAIAPADLRVMKSFSLNVEEAALTGESAHIRKTTDPLPASALPLGDRRNMVYMGTTIVYGRGSGIVTATGLLTEFGKIASMLAGTPQTRTPLQKRLEQFGKRLTAAAILISIVVMGLGLLRGEPPLLMLMTAISLAVAAIPEALPAVVTISLALGARRMVQRQALIRKLPAVETLGSVTVICSDKTGTLTMNRMTVERFYCEGELTAVAGAHGRWNDLLRAMALSNDVDIVDGNLKGDSTEVAVVLAAGDAGWRKADLVREFPRAAEAPFDSDRKLMTTIHRLPEGGFIAYTKGATEAVLPRLAVSSDAAAIDAAEGMAADGLRVLAFASRHWAGLPEDRSPENIERDLQFIGLVAIGDPARPEALESVRMCRAAGIEPVMITGDHPQTALSIARQLEMIESDGNVWTGRELAKASPEEIRRRVGDIRVYARVTPDQKLTLVQALQERGHVVAMTGDGVNDAPALKKADIGVAMGITGTEVTKESSSMILLDDNFATIVGAVREGRMIYDNLRRFIRYAVTTNASEVWTMFVASLVGLPIPLLPVQILWINLVTDGLPGLALAAEPAERNVMSRPPRPPNESVFAHGLGAHVIWVSVLMAVLALGTQYWALELGTPRWQTIVVTAIAFSQLAHVLAIRSERESLLTIGLFSNLPLLGAVVATALLQLGVVYVPTLNGWFKTQPLTVPELGICFLVGSVIFAAVETEKWWRRRFDFA
jgi:Ca2+-transporting ATPase